MSLELTGTVVAVTGHRPNKLGYDYPLKSPLCIAIKNRLQQEIDKLKPDVMISGMALGVDTIWAKLAIQNYIPLVAAVPFTQQDTSWPMQSRHYYTYLLSMAEHVVNVTGKSDYRPQYMQQRNEWMVDHCNHLVAVWDGSPGGTGNCVKYAKKKLDPRQISIINPLYLTV